MNIPRPTYRCEFCGRAADTHIIWPPDLNISVLRNVLSPSSTLASHRRIEVGRDLAACPVAILTSGIV